MARQGEARNGYGEMEPEVEPKSYMGRAIPCIIKWHMFLADEPPDARPELVGLVCQFDGMASSVLLLG